MKIKLIKISDNKNSIRTNEIIGETNQLPEVGKTFQMTAQGLEFGTRYICTSLVREFLPDGSFKTENSVYKVEIL